MSAGESPHIRQDEECLRHAINAAMIGKPGQYLAHDALDRLFEQLQTAEREKFNLGVALDATVKRAEDAERERDSLASRLRAEGYNVSEILAFDAAHSPAKRQEDA
jgi:hypothetical protein